ncbi:hypothetical protein LVJ94_02525 [Pendulispora rubella]|uniref:DUF1579 domain-containing protein n=1 Tax=Pendulispora rubella TaxID=2741070 RepID=A0ABZ2L5K1_9BACT
MQIRIMFALVPAFAVIACGGAQTAPHTPESRSVETHSETIQLASGGNMHDFDFLDGNWTVTRRRLKVRGVGSRDWEEYVGTTKTTQYLGGMVSVEESVSPSKGSAGVTLNVFNPEKRQWSIYEINGKAGKLEPPNVGGFTGTRGEFYGDDEDNGRPIKVRYIWLKLSPDSARWEQSFSYDNGHTWETNRTSAFTRAR